MKQLLAILFLLVALVSARSQVTLNITNYGAVGNLTNFTGSVTAGSATIGTPLVWNTNATIGQVIQIYACRTNTWTYILDPQGTIGVVTNVNKGTNLVVSFLSSTNTILGSNYIINLMPSISTNALCVIGNNNYTNFRNAELSAESFIGSNSTTSVLINVPNGHFLDIPTNLLDPAWIPSNYANASPAVVMNSGGISWVGVGFNSRISPMGVPVSRVDATGRYDFFRNYIWGIQSGLTNYALPINFTNICYDGTVPKVDRLNTPAYTYSWDVTMGGILYYPFVGGAGPAVISTVGVMGTNMLGEINKMNGLQTNSIFVSSNSIFSGSSGSAFNPNSMSMTILRNQIQNCRIFIENYLSGAQSNSVVAFNTNSAGGVIALNGILKTDVTRTTTLITSNWLDSGTDVIDLGPAENVILNNNTLTNSVIAINFTGSPQPGDGTQDINSNVVVTANDFSGIANGVYITAQPVNGLYCTNNFGGFNAALVGGQDGLQLSAGGGNVWVGTVTNFNWVENIYQNGSTFYTNTLLPDLGDSFKTNLVFIGNVCQAIYCAPGNHYSAFDSRNTGTNGQYFLDISNNVTGFKDTDTVGITNIITYGLGRNHNIQSTAGSSLWVVDDIRSNQIPVGAELVISNSTGSTLPVYLSTSRWPSGGSTNLANGSTVVLEYSKAGNYWTNGTPYVPQVIAALYAPVLK